MPSKSNIFRKMVNLLQNNEKITREVPHWVYNINYHPIKKKIDYEEQEYEKLEQIKFENDTYFAFSYYNFKGERTIYAKIEYLINNAIKEDSFLLVSSLYINSYEIYELLIKASKILKGKVYILDGYSKDTHFFQWMIYRIIVI